MAESELEEPVETTESEQEETRAPLGMYAPFDISDEKLYTQKDLEAAAPELKLAENIRAMVVAACARESLGRRIEISQAWRLQLMDRGLHRLVPQKGGAWTIDGQNSTNGLGIYGNMQYNNLHDLNIIGVHNDIIVSALTRDIPKTEFTAKSEDNKAVTAADAANKIKWFIQEDACYKKNQAILARTYCTDERSVLYMRPVADAPNLGFEDDSEDVVPETEDVIPAGGPTKKPRIQTMLNVYGKLEHKCQIGCDDDMQSPYQIIANEFDTASLRAEFPWIAEKIKGGSAGIAELELDRVARASIKLAINGGAVTGQGNNNDTTKLRCWLSPKFYWDDSCSEDCREWLLENMPKGLLAVYPGTDLAFVRNEAWQEVLTVTHARTGKGQNRRALTEAYAGPNMILDNWMDMLNKFFTATVPRLFLDKTAFDVDKIRASSGQVGRTDPFNAAMVPPGVNPMLIQPTPTHQPALPDFIRFFAGDLAQLLTGAQLTMIGGEGSVQSTLGEAKMDNDSAMTRLSEPWAATCAAFGNATRQAVEWNARVQPDGKVFDRVIGSQGRLRVEMSEIDAQVLSVAETDTNFPESWSEREERVWQMIQEMPTNPFLAGIMMHPANARIIKDAARMGITIPGAASWDKQEGEFTLLLSGKPLPNPQVAQLQIQINELKHEMERVLRTSSGVRIWVRRFPRKRLTNLRRGSRLSSSCSNKFRPCRRWCHLWRCVPMVQRKMQSNRHAALRR